MKRRAHEDLRRLALSWCYEHLDTGLDAHRLAGLWLEDRLKRGLTPGAVPPRLLEALDEPEAQRALDELLEARLVYRRRLDGYQLTDEGLVLGRAMAGATSSATRGADPEVLAAATAMVDAELLKGTPPGQVLEAIREDLGRELRRVQDELERQLLDGTGTGIPRGLLDRDEPPSTYEQEHHAQLDELERQRELQDAQDELPEGHVLPEDLPPPRPCSCDNPDMDPHDTEGKPLPPRRKGRRTT